MCSMPLVWTLITNWLLIDRQPLSDHFFVSSAAGCKHDTAVGMLLMFEHDFTLVDRLLKTLNVVSHRVSLSK